MQFISSKSYDLLVTMISCNKQNCVVQESCKKACHLAHRLLGNLIFLQTNKIVLLKLECIRRLLSEHVLTRNVLKQGNSMIQSLAEC